MIYSKCLGPTLLIQQKQKQIQNGIHTKHFFILALLSNKKNPEIPKVSFGISHGYMLSKEYCTTFKLMWAIHAFTHEMLSEMYS